MRALLRDPDHYAELLPFLKAIAGETASIHGSPRYDEAGCVFAIKDMCQQNGFTLLANLNPAQVSRVFQERLQGQRRTFVRQAHQAGQPAALGAQEESGDG